MSKPHLIRMVYNVGRIDSVLPGLMFRSSTNFIGVIVYTSSGRTEEERERATAMLGESLAISTELGMRPLMERVLSRREILKA